jgi:6-phosphogluconate dehydrogenase
MLEEHDIGFMDCGTSGGVWGLDNGYCLMVGATTEVAKAVEPVLRALAVPPQKLDGFMWTYWFWPLYKNDS